VITLNRPEKLNAFSNEMLDAWQESITRASVDQNVRVIIITGEGRGFCSGADVSRERAGADVLGVVSIHGILAPGDIANEAIRAKVLCLHGHDDPMAPPEQVAAFQQEMTAARVDWQVHCYGLTMHAFTNPRANNPDFGTVFNADAKRRAHQSLKSFLAELFSSDRASA